MPLKYPLHNSLSQFNRTFIGPLTVSKVIFFPILGPEFADKQPGGHCAQLDVEHRQARGARGQGGLLVQALHEEVHRCPGP